MRMCTPRQGRNVARALTLAVVDTRLRTDSPLMLRPCMYATQPSGQRAFGTRAQARCHLLEIMEVKTWSHASSILKVSLIFPRFCGFKMRARMSCLLAFPVRSRIFGAQAP
jgi:hypothetical protein